jgi:cytidylate kinase
MIVTIDGPAGSGKSTAARGLAARLGFEFLDTGAMYRAVALALRRAGIDFADEVRVTPALAALRLEMPPEGGVLIDGEDVAGLIRTPEMASASSKVAAFGHVRRVLVELQRNLARGRDIVCEGRDQGTVVFPDACCKIFLTASSASRAARRLGDLQRRGIQVTLDEVLAEQEERDRRDSERDVAPLRPAADAVVIDTSGLTVGQVLDRLEEEVCRCRRG